MGKEYKIETIQNDGTHDQIICIELGGLFIDIFTYPNGKTTVTVHAPNDKMEIETDSEFDSRVKIRYTPVKKN